MDFDLGTSRVYTETKGKNQVWSPLLLLSAENVV